MQNYLKRHHYASKIFIPNTIYISAKICMVPIAAFRNVSNLITIEGFEGISLEVLIINYTYHKANSL